MNLKKIGWVVFLIVLLASATANSQYYFGKNKVQYITFDWQVLSTPHFDIYFYPQEKEIAEIAGGVAEESYRFLESKFNHHIEKKIPLIVYSTPYYFQQTNVIPNILPENVGGFTEFLKGRVVVPFNNSYSGFARTLRHELVHVFSFEKLSRVMKAHKKHNFDPPPLWFEEGLAEYWSGAQDSDAEMILKDLVLSGNLVSIKDMGRIYGTYLMYKEGESFCNFISEEYGDYRLALIYDNYFKEGDFSKTVEITFGKPLEKLGEEWEYHLKKKYFPHIEDSDFPDKVARKLTYDGINLKPVIVRRDSENWIAFKSNKLGYSSIYLMSPRGEKEKLITLIKGERSYEFESLHLLESRIDASEDGRILFVSKRNEKDVLYVYDTKEMKISRDIDFDSLVVLSSPSWSKDAGKITFAGSTDRGFCDLYYYDLECDSLFRLTFDLYQEKDPCFSPDGEKIVFSSDRGRFGEKGYLNLFCYDLNSNEIQVLTSGEHNDINPTWKEKGIVFSSDRQGGFDLFLLDDASKTYRITNLLTGAFDPRISDEESSLVFTGFQDYSFQIYKMPFGDSLLFPLPDDEGKASLVSCEEGWCPDMLSGEHRKGTVKYKNKFSFDIAQSAISYDAIYGPIGGFQGALTDVLGNNQIYFLLANTAQSKSDFFKSFNLGVTYLNKSRRLNYGLGAYHLYDEYSYSIKDFYNYYTERQYGGILFGSYPLSKFRRVEAKIFLRQSERDYYIERRKRKAFLATNYVSFIKDTSIWDWVGPIDGTRLNLTLGLTLGLDDRKIYNRLVLFDFRKYLRLGKYSCYAFRFTGFSSEGEEPQRLFLGGSWSLRGYSRRAFYGRNMVLINNELRFPLIDDLYIGFPIGKIGFQAIRGALFFDLGNAWDKYDDELHASYGLGARLGLGYLVVLRFDFARNLDTKDWVFDFFFGWNF
ncbi:MAG: hypothetical protein AMJ90_01505 [candidate division Zixibacteria bacterium SM23_73_2]|nr:MAG: hypothetical protein AMJ90_01505 [candidate division Zixibacteria bacterium SM23_73_2]